MVWFSFIKKITKLKFKKKSKPVQIGQFRFGLIWFFRTKTGLARFFPVWLDFFLVFFCLGSVRFGYFDFRLIKPNQTGRFLQNFNRFFHGSVFSIIFFSSFLNFFGFSVFFSPLILIIKVATAFLLES